MGETAKSRAIDPDVRPRLAAKARQPSIRKANALIHGAT
jgi:hypothetical protein